MITLATLPQATAQQVYDQVARHLLTQMERACAYHGAPAYFGDKFVGDDPLKSAGGCLMTDDEWEPDMEGDDWKTLTREGYVPSTAHDELIAALEAVHDCAQPDDWREAIREVAARMGLSPAVLDEFHWT